MKQTDRVLAYIETNGSISDAEAYTLLRIRRLAARVWDLRAAGHDIRMKTEAHEGGTHARYYIPAVPIAAGQMELTLSGEASFADKSAPPRRTGMVLPTGCRPR